MFNINSLARLKKKNKFKNLSFNSQVDPKDLILYDNRANKVRLTWPKQVVKILDKKKFFNKKKSINDLGCNWFQFYKELKFQKKKIDYFGYDHDINFVRIGLKYFPELKKKFEIGNIENKKIRPSDLNIASIVLDHVENPQKFLSNFFKSRQMVVLRCYLGEKNIIKLFSNKRLVKKSYFINQFSFESIVRIFHKYNFAPTFYLDNATKQSKMHEIANGYNVYRKIFIIIGKKYL
jgi:hypothetical protein